MGQPGAHTRTDESPAQLRCPRESVVPELTKIADYFEKDEKDFPKELMLMKAKCVRETIRAIEASTESPELIRLK